MVDFSALNFPIRTPGAADAIESFKHVNGQVVALTKSGKEMTFSVDQFAQAWVKAGGKADLAMKILTVSARDAQKAMDAEAAATQRSAAAHTEAAVATGAHSFQLGRLNMELGTAIGRLTGTNTALTRLGAMIGGNALGFPQMIASMAAIGGLIWVFEKLTGRIGEAAKEQKKFNEELAHMANAGESAGLKKAIQDLYFGTPYDDKNELRKPSSMVKGAFEGSIADLQAKIAEAKKRAPSLADAVAGGLGAPTYLQALQNQLDPLLKKTNALYDAMKNVRDASAEIGMLPTRTTAASPKTRSTAVTPTEEIDTLDFTGKLSGTRDRLMARLNSHLVELEAKQDEEFEKAKQDALAGIANMRAKPAKLPVDVDTSAIVARMKAIGQQAGDSFVASLASTLSRGFEIAFAGGSGKDVFKSLAGGVLAGLGTVFEQVGTAALVGLGIMQQIKDAILSFAPEVGIAAAIGLIALGAALHGAGSALTSSGSGGGGYGGGYSAPSSYTHTGYVSPAAPSGTATPAGAITARSSVTNVNYIIGPADPQAQRMFDELTRASAQRGSLA
jgi:hypothetical protein